MGRSGSGGIWAAKLGDEMGAASYILCTGEGKTAAPLAIQGVGFSAKWPKELLPLLGRIGGGRYICRAGYP